jgi:hypothetical protein
MKKFTAYFTLLILPFFFFSTQLSAQKDDDFNFPPDFGKTATTILIAPATKDKVTESFADAFEKEYKGLFELTADAFPKSSKYKAAKYKYVFVAMEKENPAQTIGRDRFPATTDYKFGLRDMLTGKTYYQDFWSGSYKKGARNYVKHLEKLRKQNAGE